MEETPQEERICFDSARTPHICSTKWVDSKVEVEGEDTGLARIQRLQRVLCRNFGLINLEELDKNYERGMYLASGQLEKLSKETSIAKLEDNQTISMLEADDGVGELEPQGVCIGVAPLDWRPAKIDSKNVATAKASASALLQQVAHDNQSSYGEDSMRRNMAFHEFKHTISEGTQQSYILNTKKSELKEKKLTMQNLAVKLNDCKQEIHELNVLLTGQTSDGTKPEQAVAETTKVVDEGQLQERLEQAKTDYQRCFAELVQLKDKIQPARKEILECQERLLDSFFKWYKRDKEK
ncbi:hypothetical protein L7F22_024655 [Adiantum nelumboides]|nr:hypothetical protein [Adiantum nelumboides]